MAAKRERCGLKDLVRLRDTFACLSLLIGLAAPIIGVPAEPTPATPSLAPPGVEAPAAPSAAQAPETPPGEAAAPVAVSILRDMSLLDDVQRLGKGDRISYRVIEDEEVPKPLTVMDTGEVEVPFYGLVMATGKTCRELASEIKELVEKELYYKATVIIGLELVNRARSVGRVYVAGQVRTPGSIELLANETNTVSKVILKSGGFGDFADKKKVQLFREAGAAGKRAFVVNVDDIWKKGLHDEDLVVQPDDQIFVPARLVNF